MLVAVPATVPTGYVLLLAEHRASNVSDVGVTLQEDGRVSSWSRRVQRDWQR